MYGKFNKSQRVKDEKGKLKHLTHVEPVTRVNK